MRRIIFRFRFSALFRIGITTILGCTTPIAPQVTFAPPKIYSDEYLVRILSERRQNLRKINDTIKAAEIQELMGIRQGVQRDARFTAQPATGTPPAAEPINTTNLTLPNAP